MTSGLPDGPLPELSTTRVASGSSARMVALGVAGVLLAVVGFVVVNRPSPPLAQVPTAAPAAVVATPAPTPNEADVPIRQLKPDGVSPVNERYDVALVVAERHYPGQLYAVDDDVLGATFAVSRELLGQEATLEIIAVMTPRSPDIVIPIGQWQIPLGFPDAAHASELILLDELVPGAPDGGAATPLAVGGFHITVRMAGVLNQGAEHLVYIDVAQAPITPAPPEAFERVRDYRYAAVVQITGGTLRAALTSSAKDVYAGSMVVNSADVGDALTLELGREWSDLGFQILETFDSWNIGLQQLRRTRGRFIDLLIAHVPPRLTRLNGPEPTSTGYTFSIRGRRDGANLLLGFELVWPQQYQVETYSGPRGPGLFNRCRWGDGPQAAPPRGSHDEASCLGT